MSETDCKVRANPGLIDGVAKFETSSLKRVKAPAEKVVLPSKEDIECEKQHLNFVTGVETFDKNKLKPTVTQEKVVLPDKEGIYYNPPKHRFKF
jgi:hypothetical protein